MRADPDMHRGADPYYQGGHPVRPRRRGMFGTLMAAVGVIAFAGAIVVVYGGGGERTVQEGGLPLIQADTTPTKMRPEQPGGMEVPHQDKLVYDRLAQSSQQRPPVERLLPPPEQVLPRPVVAPEPPPPPPMPSTPTVAAPPPAVTPVLPQDAAPAPSAAVPQPPVSAQPHPAPTTAPSTAPAQAPSATAAHPAAAPAPAKPPAAAQQAPQSITALLAQQGALPSAAAPKPSGGSGQWRVQLASVRSEAEAESEWKRLSSRYPDALGGLAFRSAKADLGDKGIYYRVQGSGVDEERAKAICTQLRAQGVGCVVVRP